MDKHLIMMSFSSESLEKLRYPIGKFELPDKITKGHLDSWVDVLTEFPSKLGKLVSGLNDQQLDTPYRPEG